MTALKGAAPCENGPSGNTQLRVNYTPDQRFSVIDWLLRAGLAAILAVELGMIIWTAVMLG